MVIVFIVACSMLCVSIASAFVSLLNFVYPSHDVDPTSIKHWLLLVGFFASVVLMFLSLCAMSTAYRVYGV